MSLRQLPVIDAVALAGPRAAARPPVAAPAPLAEFATEDVALPRFHVWTLGCQMNHSDSEEMAGALLVAGCREAASLEEAELIVINSCAIREAAEQKVIGRMGALARLKQADPGLRVVLTGCAVRADNAAELRRRYPAVDLFLRPDEEPDLAAHLGLASPTASGRLAAGAPAGAGAGRAAAGSEAHFARVGRSVAATADRLPGTRRAAVRQRRVARQGGAHAWLPIIYGCDKSCTYCIVPFSRGPERSRPFDDVVEEARQLAAAGVQEVTLLGQNVNSYGHDLPPEPRFADVKAERSLGRRIPLDGRPDIAAVLRAIDAVRTTDGQPAIPRLRFVTSHPWDLTDRLIEAMAECPSVCEHLHLPVQSGDDAVLRRMGRQYTVEAYLRLVERVRAAISGLSLTTDVIVGFCGETEAQFEATLALLREVGFDQVFAAAFSPRPGTPAARLPDDVPREEKRRRLNRLLALQEAISQERNQAWLGRVTEVLADEVRQPRRHAHDVEQRTDRAATDGAVRLAGRNRENRLVHFDGPPDLLGRRVAVRIEHAGPYALAGSVAG
ncbi:MAG TPA: MiaB/RimO family radical SAM methylthiotransferase [Candidatus Limnocylindrales bacterium]|nr:MiaB/RimO family radical SAM methylthiotransferase [Candidatus Limnocylindrales bacterium]